MKLTRPASLYQLDDILENCRPVKAMSEGFTDQHAGKCMVVALVSMDLCEQLTALLPGNTPH
jgi:hypothetical protein